MKLGAVLAVLLVMPATAMADRAADWAELADRIATAADDAPDHEATPATSLAGSRVALAMFEAVNAVSGRYMSYLHLPPAPAGASQEAAADAAARAVLDESFPAARAEIDTYYGKSIASVPDGSPRQDGIALGVRAASSVMARPATDPSAQPTPPYRPVTEPGRWVPTALASIPDFVPTQRTWFLPDGMAVLPPPPPAPDTAQATHDYIETMTLGARHSNVRTADQTRTARFWSDYDYLPALRQVEERPGRTLVENCRFYAMVSMSLDDSSVALVDAKMHYMAWRPVTAIRNGDRTGNPSMQRVADWTPLLRTPMHPEYPCGHCELGGSLSTLLVAQSGHTAGTLYTFKTRTQAGGEQRLTLADYAQVVSDSRIWGGVHFRSSAVAGRALGERVAAMTLATFAPPAAGGSRTK